MSHTYQGGLQDAKWKIGNRKSIHVSDLSIDPSTHNNHGCILTNGCLTYKVDARDGYFLHHRIGWKVSDQCKDKKCVKYDPIVLKYKTRLEIAMKNVVAHIFSIF